MEKVMEKKGTAVQDVALVLPKVQQFLLCVVFKLIC